MFRKRSCAAALISLKSRREILFRSTVRPSPRRFFLIFRLLFPCRLIFRVRCNPPIFAHSPLLTPTSLRTLSRRTFDPQRFPIRADFRRFRNAARGNLEPRRGVFLRVRSASRRFGASADDPGGGRFLRTLRFRDARRTRGFSRRRGAAPVASPPFRRRPRRAFPRRRPDFDLAPPLRRGPRLRRRGALRK